MSFCKTFGLAIFAVICLLGETTSSAQAQVAVEWSGGKVINLGGLSGSTSSAAFAINDAGQAVGYSLLPAYPSSPTLGYPTATEWSGDKVINLGGVRGFYISEAENINNAGQVVGWSVIPFCCDLATEWSGGSVMNLGGLPGLPSPGSSFAFGINNAGQAVGYSGEDAIEWSGGSVINLGLGIAFGINNAGKAVGESIVSGVQYATEWSGSSVINLEGLPGSTGSQANGINDAGQAVGWSFVGGIEIATEWSGGDLVNLGCLPGSTVCTALSINDAGQVVGYSTVGGVEYATEWSDGDIINLGPGVARGINDTGQVAGYSASPPPPPIPEPSTWAMMLLGFAGLAFAGYSRARTLRMF